VKSNVVEPISSCERVKSNVEQVKSNGEESIASCDGSIHFRIGSIRSQNARSRGCDSRDLSLAWPTRKSNARKKAKKARGRNDEHTSPASYM